MIRRLDRISDKRHQGIDYGIDAPGIARMLFVVGMAALFLALVSGLSAWLSDPWRIVAAGVFGVVSAYALVLGAFMVYSSKVAKLRRRDRLLDLVAWTGRESVLDIGCGRGLLLIGAAKRLTTGKVVGIDVWRAKDQSANTPEATIENARLEGVADRIEVQTADMRSLGFGDASFDVILSHWAVHNVSERQDRKVALREMVRVLKPGGMIVLADIRNHDEYAAELKACGLQEVRMVENGMATKLSALLWFGSIRPAAVIGRKRS